MYLYTRIYFTCIRKSLEAGTTGPAVVKNWEAYVKLYTYFGWDDTDDVRFIRICYRLVIPWPWANYHNHHNYLFWLRSTYDLLIQNYQHKTSSPLKKWIWPMSAKISLTINLKTKFYQVMCILPLVVQVDMHCDIRFSICIEFDRLWALLETCATFLKALKYV